MGAGVRDFACLRQGVRPRGYAEPRTCFLIAVAGSRAGGFKRRGACAVPLGVGGRCHGNGILQYESCGYCRTALVGPDAMSTLVVYVHGLWLSGNEAGILLRRLSRELNAKTRAFSYPSVTSNISDSAQALGKFLSQQRAETLHLVGHSLGGLVILKLFESGKGAQLPPGRIVLLGSPLNGSRAAQNLARLPFGKKILGRGVHEELLTERPRRWMGP